MSVEYQTVKFSKNRIPNRLWMPYYRIKKISLLFPIEKKGALGAINLST